MYFVAREVKSDFEAKFCRRQYMHGHASASLLFRQNFVTHGAKINTHSPLTIWYCAIQLYRPSYEIGSSFQICCFNITNRYPQLINQNCSSGNKYFMLISLWMAIPEPPVKVIWRRDTGTSVVFPEYVSSMLNDILGNLSTSSRVVLWRHWPSFEKVQHKQICC